MTALGFIGTGNLAGFLVEGLSRARAGYDIMVSPRNASRARDLNERFGARIARDNQQIIDTCDVVLVGVLPHDAKSVLAGLNYRPDQTILSAMAGASLEQLRQWVAPADAAVSMMPGLANAVNAGPSVLYPDNGPAFDLLSQLGPVHVYDTQHAFNAASVMGAFSGMSTLMMRDAMAWFAAHGLTEDDARRLVAETLKGNATMLLETGLTMDEVARGVVTPGGITEHGRKILDAGGSWADALDSVYKKISGRD